MKNARGEEVTLRGVNAGGLGVVELWMNGFQYGGGDDGIYCQDHYTLTQEFLSRFGEEKTKELWLAYQQNWWSDDDFKNCADMGMNVIRLPFTYMNVDFDAVTNFENAGKNYDFTMLDDFIDGAASHGLYVILDLHGAYGSQNGKDHSGQSKAANEVD
ncbi:MAG: cellulase family glycosylhydrolase, partial [Clostridia bacterium]|nr:cellulase family glycosylhydrolase [Clostridia bacterium]